MLSKRGLDRLAVLVSLVVIGLMIWSAATALGAATAPCALSPVASSAAQARIQATCVYAMQDAKAVAGRRAVRVSVPVNACLKITRSVFHCAANVTYSRRGRRSERCQWQGTLKGRSKDPARLKLVGRGMIC